MAAELDFGAWFSTYDAVLRAAAAAAATGVCTDCRCTPACSTPYFKLLTCLYTCHSAAGCALFNEFGHHQKIHLEAQR